MIDFSQLQVGTLRRYERHFKIPAKPGMNKHLLLLDVRFISLVVALLFDDSQVLLGDLREKNFKIAQWPKGFFVQPAKTGAVALEQLVAMLFPLNEL